MAEKTLDQEMGMFLPPGFRFHPTDEELITHYLIPKVLDSNFSSIVIADVDLNKCEPWDLPWKAKGDMETEWYFFCVKDRKYPTGLRANRATEKGYWKATGKDKAICKKNVVVGMKKTLVFYKGRAPKGEKSGWVMHEYRIEEKSGVIDRSTSVKMDWTLCRIYEKDAGGKKTHICNMVRSDTFTDQIGTSVLPPFIDYVPSYISETKPVVAETGHVTCFSKMPLPGSFYPTEDLLGNSLYSNSGFSLQQAFLKDILENPGSIVRQDCLLKRETVSMSQDTVSNVIKSQLPSQSQSTFDELLDTLSSSIHIGDSPWR